MTTDLEAVYVLWSNMMAEMLDAELKRSQLTAQDI